MCRWIVDADQIQELDYKSDILYENDSVRQYLNEERKFAIISPKGYGKTFLLKAKRMKSQNSGVCCIPQDALCDILPSINIGANSSIMEDYSKWVSLWEVAIYISVIKYEKNMLPQEYIKSLNIKDDLLKYIFETPFITNPCQILGILLTSNEHFSRKDLLDTIDKIPELVAMIQTIHSPIHIFIDKVDQAFKDNIHLIEGSSSKSRGKTNRSFWSYAQYSLLEAAYNVFTHNSHIKTYFGIRKEALSGHEDYTDLALQLSSYAVELEYDDADLRALFIKYVQNEEKEWLICPDFQDKNPVRAFFGLQNIRHGYVKKANGQYVSEEIFDYLIRHTLRRPRDIMHICYSICHSNVSENAIESLRHIINAESRFLLQAYIREVGPFVFDDYADKWDKLWKTIDRNVFGIEYAYDICKSINVSETGSSCNKNCSDCSLFKPFSRLYNAGLLGIIKRNNIENGNNKNITIEMEKTGNAVICSHKETLPISKLYFLHPCLTNKIESERIEQGFPFNVCRKAIIGDSYKINNTVLDKIMEDEKLLIRRNVFISSTCNDLEDERAVLRDQLYKLEYIPVLSEYPEFGSPEDDISSYDYCLDKINSSIRGFVFIIGKRYGGVYDIDRNPLLKYKKEAKALQEDIKKATGIDNMKPSISLMEWYIAKKHGVTPFVLVRKNIYNERLSYSNNKESFCPKFVEDNRIFDEITFITRQPTSNWIKIYDDIVDFREIVKIQFEEDRSAAYHL